MTRRILPAVLLTAFLLGCGSDNDQDGSAASDTAAAADGAAEEATPDASSGAADSIPMTVSVTLPSSTPPMGKIRGGTFQGRGKGARCEHLAEGPREWAVIYAGSDDPLQVGPVTLDVARVSGGTSNAFALMAVAGSIEATGGPSMPLTHHISTTQPGAPTTSMGSGTVTVTRDGQRVRFEMDAVSGTTKEPLKMTLVCEREGKWI
jgi:hypothetical protein